MARCHRLDIAGPAVLAACLASLTVAGAAPAASRPEAMPSLQAAVLPCDATCGAGDAAILQVGAPGTPAGFRAPIGSPLIKLDSMAYNSIGRLVIVGEVKDGIFDVLVADPRQSTILAEFWTMHVGVSPYADHVAFTAFVASHGAESLYADTMVYSYDTTRAATPTRTLSAVPAGAAPVFPRELVVHGRDGVLAESPYRLLHVVSSDIEWFPGDIFSFYGALLPVPGGGVDDRLYPVTITRSAVLSDSAAVSARGALPSVGAPFLCYRKQIADWTVQGIIRACAQGR